ncbi:MAG: TIGR02710 family CRISPR-associated CARF protein [Bacillota bacterium]|jgi:CRISPR-associated protein (TIGR02710 family)
MARVLIISVGGTCEPIVTACIDYSPDYIFFICSGGTKGASSVLVDGPGKPCIEKISVKCPKCGKSNSIICSECNAEIYTINRQPSSIVSQIGFAKDRYEKVEVEDPDNLYELFLKLNQVENRIKELYPPPYGVEVVANYTGGTKTMSVALGLMASMNNWLLTFNKARRTDLLKITAGDIPEPMQYSPFLEKHYIRLCGELLEQYHYHAVDNLLRNLPSFFDKGRLNNLRRLCKAFHQWDSFNYSNAYAILKNNCRKDLGQYVALAAKLSREKLGSLEMVIDLILNSERRACQGKYDDAVSRLYRALEMLAQIRLRDYGINTASVKLDDMPNEFLELYPDLKKETEAQLGLKKSYILLSCKGDSLGKLYIAKESQITEKLKVRNSSFLAHGFSPVSKANYEEILALSKGIVNEVYGKVNWLQLPNSILCDWC